MATTATRLETVDSLVYRYTPDPPPDAADRWRAVARARVLDEITGEAVLQSIEVTSARKDLVARSASGGLVGLVARPERVFPELATLPVQLDLSLAAAGYLPLDLEGSLGPIAGFPAAFTALDFGDVMLHRPGVALAGRVVRNTTVAPPLAGATVRVDALWSTLPPANWAPPALLEAPDMVALQPGLYAPRNVGATIARRDLTLSAQTKTLLLPLVAGATRARLSDRLGLAAGNVLMLDRDDPMRLEAIELAQVDTFSSADQPAWVTLAHPAKQLHRPAVVCTEGFPQAPLSPTTLNRAGSPGDRVTFLAAAPGFAVGDVVEIAGGAAAREFQHIDRYETTTDAAGFFRLPPIARVALLRLRAQHAGFSDATPIVTLDYRSAVQIVTLRLE